LRVRHGRRISHETLSPVDSFAGSCRRVVTRLVEVRTTQVKTAPRAYQFAMVVLQQSRAVGTDLRGTHRIERSPINGVRGISAVGIFRQFAVDHFQPKIANSITFWHKSNAYFWVLD